MFQPNLQRGALFPDFPGYGLIPKTGNRGDEQSRE